MKDREAWQAAVHELQRVRHDLVTKQYYSIVVQSLYICIYVYTYVYMYVCIYICVCVYIYINVCVCVYIYIHTHTEWNIVQP